MRLRIVQPCHEDWDAMHPTEQGRFCDVCASEVHDLIPAANAEKMYRTVYEYGQYPIDVERVEARRRELAASGELKLRAIAKA